MGAPTGGIKLWEAMGMRPKSISGALWVAIIVLAIFSIFAVSFALGTPVVAGLLGSASLLAIVDFAISRPGKGNF